MKKIFIGILTVLWLCSFGQKASTDLTTQANIIKNETIASRNTATRIGIMFTDIIASFINKQDFANVSATGTDTYLANITPDITSYSSFHSMKVIFANDNTGASTINVDGLGAKNIYLNGAALTGGEINGGVPYILIYDGTQYQIIGGSGGGGGGSGTVTSIATSNGITGGTITTTGTISGVNSQADASTKGVSTYVAADFSDNGSGTIALDYANGQAATGSQDGFLQSADWTTFNNKGSGTVTSIATTSPITGGTITSTGTIACPTCVTSAASLTANNILIGGGSQASSSTTTGTGILTALSNNIGSAGAPVLFNGAGGTPSSMTGTNITGTASGLTAGTVTTNANLTGEVTSVGNAASLGSFTSASLATALTNETGTAAAVFANTPTVITPDFTTGFTIGTAAAIGKFIVGNGTNYVPSTSTIPTSAGSSGKILVSDGTNYVLSTPTFPNASATTRKIIVSDGTNWTASTETYASPGASGNLLVSDGTNWTSATATGTYLTVNNPAYTGTLSTGTLGYSDTDILASFQKSVNSYAQLIIQNTNSGATASGDIVISSDNGTATTHYLNLGRNSSGFTGSGSLNGVGYGYLTNTSEDLVIGTTTNHSLRFLTNSATTDALNISGAGLFTYTVPVPNSVFTSTWTAGANNDATFRVNGTQTSRSTASDFISKLDIAGAVNLANTNFQRGSLLSVTGTIDGGNSSDIPVGLWVAPTISGSASQSSIAGFFANTGNVPVDIIAQSAGGSAFLILRAGSTADIGVTTQRFYWERAPGTNGVLNGVNSGTGAVNFNLNGSNVVTFTSAGKATFVGGIQGTTTNDNATAGNYGEYSESLIASGSAVSLTTATTANVTSLSLTAGDWIVFGNINYTGSSATVTSKISGINSTSATMPTDGSEVYSGVTVTLLSNTDGSTIPGKRFSLSGTTTVYLVAQCTFSAGSVSAYGKLSARRIR